VTRYKLLAVNTRYWKPDEDYIVDIVAALTGRVHEGDIVVVSEKAVSTATSNIIDESFVKPSFMARFLAKCWMRYVWTYILGPLCHLRKRTICHFRNYPVKEGSAHKQVALQHCSFLQALMHSSEGGIDGSNLPYSYVSLPLSNAHEIAEKICNSIKAELGKNVTVIIADTDKTYSWKNLHFTPRPKPIKGILSVGGFIAYVVGRSFKFKRRATPLAVAGAKITVEEALRIAELANRARRFGAGRTIWDMAETFQVSLTGVSWKMLKETKHKPIVIVRRTDGTA
jgi:F420-0:gamma-glutamyl ligase-like protein